MLFKEMSTIYSASHIRPIYTFCQQSCWLLRDVTYAVSTEHQRLRKTLIHSTKLDCWHSNIKTNKNI